MSTGLTFNFKAVIMDKEQIRDKQVRSEKGELLF